MRTGPQSIGFRQGVFSAFFCLGTQNGKIHKIGPVDRPRELPSVQPADCFIYGSMLENRSYVEPMGNGTNPMVTIVCLLVGGLFCHLRNYDKEIYIIPVGGKINM